MFKKISKKNYNKVGILGGTFDPPHKGHLYISKFAIKKLKLNKLIWIITKKNPLKRPPSMSITKRINLSKKITSREKKILVCYFDDKVKSNNTFDLLNFLKKNYFKKKLFFVMGDDNLSKFNKWKKWKKIPKLAKMVVFPREDYSFESLKPSIIKKLNKKDWIFMDAKKVNISSSLIRKFW